MLGEGGLGLQFYISITYSNSSTDDNYSIMIMYVTIIITSTVDARDPFPETRDPEGGLRKARLP
jgi:hypothetical protein